MEQLEEDEEDQLKQLHLELESFEDARAEGWERRAKEVWALGGDLPGKYFFSKLQAKRRNTKLPMFPGINRENMSDHVALKHHV